MNKILLLAFILSANLSVWMARYVWMQVGQVSQLKLNLIKPKGNLTQRSNQLDYPSQNFHPSLLGFQLGCEQRSHMNVGYRLKFPGWAPDIKNLDRVRDGSGCRNA